MKIFVCIYSYRDLELDNTIKDLYAKADSPKDISVGVVNADDVPYKNRRKQVRVKNVDYTKYHGCGRGCYEVLTELYQGEDYIVKIDPHTRFAKGWDSYYKQFVGQDRVICSRCLGYYEDGSYDPLKNTYTVPKDYQNMFVIRLTEETLDTWPKDTLFMQAGFFMAPASWVQKVGYDPYIAMWGEETDLSMRTYLAGYKIQAVPARVFHLYGRKQRKSVDKSQEFNVLQNEGIKRAQIKLGVLPPDESVMQEWEKYGCDGTPWRKELEKSFGPTWKMIDPQTVVKCKHCGSKTFYAFGQCKWCYKDLKGSEIIKQ